MEKARALKQFECAHQVNIVEPLQNTYDSADFGRQSYYVPY
jgi:hypothetical protein